MNYKEVKNQNWVIFECVAGSLSYGTERRDKDGKLLSDIDRRGVFVYPSEERMTLFDLPAEVSEEGEDTKLYELKKFFELAIKATPNMLELLWMPKDCITFCDPKFQKIIDNRKLFITQKAVDTFGAYSISQLKKARGQKKLINNPKPEKKPEREDFCWFIPSGSKRFDTVPFKSTGIDLSKCRVSAIPHWDNAFHLFENGKGVFRGDMLVCESIGKDERDDVLGVLVYQENGFKNELKEWKQYWDWMKIRNEARWELNGEKFDFDRKNMYHTIRTLMIAENIVKKGEPIVRFEGGDLSYLRNIREGAFGFDELMEKGESIMERVETGRKTCGLPETVNRKAINDLYKELAE